MPVELLERPQVEHQLSAGGSGAVPPEMPKTAVAAPEPPEREKFNPDQIALQAETDQKFAAIAGQLGDVAVKGHEIIAQNEHKQ